MTTPPLLPDAAALADGLLADIDPKVAGIWSAPQTWRQPVHTVYLPAHQLEDADAPADPRDLPRIWGERALAALGDDPVAAARRLAEAAGDAEPAAVAELAVAKLRREPIEDLRIDFEDGFPQRGLAPAEREAQEDRLAGLAAGLIADWLDPAGAPPGAPPFCGIRFKSPDPAVRRRGLRTLLIVLGGLHERGLLRALLDPASPAHDPRALRLTLPKVQHPDQVTALVRVLELVEREWGLAAAGARIPLEIQVETPQAILGEDGAVAAARMIGAAGGRCLSLHYGTYDYSAFLGVDPARQSMEHPVADTAKGLLQVVARGRGVELSDGSTNRIPVGSPGQMREGWALHHRLVTRHLGRGIRQGWDLHPNQLVTRHLATIGYFRADWAGAAARLADYVTGAEGRFLDEPATAKVLAGFLRRAHACGAITDAELARAGVDAAGLIALEATGIPPAAAPETSPAGRDAARDAHEDKDR